MSDPTKDSNGNFIDSAGAVIRTPDDKQPVAGEQVKILNPETGKNVQGTWNGSDVVENKDQPV